MASFTLHSIPSASASASARPPTPRADPLQFSPFSSRFPSTVHSGVSVRLHRRLLGLATLDPRASGEGRPLEREWERVEELRVPQEWSTPSIALRVIFVPFSVKLKSVSFCPFHVTAPIALD